MSAERHPARGAPEAEAVPGAEGADAVRGIRPEQQGAVRAAYNLARASTVEPAASARLASMARTRSVSKRPGAMLLTRIAGASSRASDLTSAATPGRSTFDASSF